jgi:hypothetical protein
MGRLRPDPARGELLAGGVVALTVLVYVLNDRFDDTWGQGVHFLYSAVAAIAVLAMAAQTPADLERPRGWESVLYVAIFPLTLAELVNLADILGADDPPFGAAGTMVWIGLMLVAQSAWFAMNRESGISTLLAVVTFGVVTLSFVEWVFSPDGNDTFRWVLVLLALGYFALGWTRREDEPHHAAGLVNGAGLAILTIAITFLIASLLGGLVSFEGDGEDGTPGWGWELIMLAGAFALLLYATRERQSGPAYLGALNLLAFVILASGAGEDGPSLIGWPLVLIVVSGTLLAAALRDVRRAS